MIRMSRKTELYSLVEKDSKMNNKRSPMVKKVQIVNKFQLMNKVPYVESPTVKEVNSP